MSTKRQIEQIAVNEVRDYIDSTSCLRSYLQENDKTPLWDGTIFVYRGEPDKNAHFAGAVKTQIKGTEVESFNEKEKYRVSVTDMTCYMHEGGLVFFVVEILQDDLHKRKPFFIKLTPHFIQALLRKYKNNKSLELTLDELPADSSIFEDELQNFIIDAHKQISYVDKPRLSLENALRANFPIKAELCVNATTNPSLALELTSQNMVMYQDTPFASIPIADVELVPRVKETYHETVGVGGKVFFNDHSRIYHKRKITDNFGDCLLFTYPKKGYSRDSSCLVEIKYPQKGDIATAINALEFLMALKESKTITLGAKEVPVNFGEQKEQLFRDTQYTYGIYRDIEAMWEAMQIPGTFSFDDFDENGLQQYLNMVLHIHRCEPGIPNSTLSGKESFYSVMPAGKLNLLILFKHIQGKQYASFDAFTRPYIVENGSLYPLLTVALTKIPDVLFDNIHYEEQLNCYKHCIDKAPSFRNVAKNDKDKIRNLLVKVERNAKRKKVEDFISALEYII